MTWYAGCATLQMLRQILALIEGNQAVWADPLLLTVQVSDQVREVPLVAAGPRVDYRLALKVIQQSEDGQMGVFFADQAFEAGGLGFVLLLSPDDHELVQG